MEREKTEYKDLVRKLNTWKYDEKIHREYYFMEKTPENIAKFEERHSGHCEFEKDVEWAVHPEKINEYSREDMFIPTGYNVSLVKHPRYFPLFYPLTARRLRPLRWEMNCVCYLLDRAL